MTPRLLRALALLIALAAILDPAIATTRRTRPLIAVVAADANADSAEAARLAHELAESFTIVPAALANAAGTVIVGNRLPHSAEELASPVFAVLPNRASRSVTLESLRAPARAPLESRVPVSAGLRVQGAPGDTLRVTLRLGELVVDRVLQPITADNAALTVPLSFVPTAAGATHLRVSAELNDATPAAGDLVVQAVEKRWSVLFFDARPSWMSRFVRRALESDARFTVTSRVVTSRAISTSAGRAPAALASATALAPFDVIVVGAPETLGERDIAGLNTFMRQQGGGVVLLFDRRASGPFEQLTQVARWQDASAARAFAIATSASDSTVLRASHALWPAALPAGAHALANDSAGRPVLWRSLAGAGRLVVSGALDAWKFRDAAVSDFDAFWQTLIATTADQIPPVLEARLEQSLLRPGETGSIVVTLRAATLAELSEDRPVLASASAALQTSAGSRSLRLWPDGPAGRLRGILRAPEEPGTYTIVVESEGAALMVPLIVASERAAPSPAEHDLLGAFATARGGTVLRSSQTNELQSTLLRTLEPTRRRETWHPMRTPWWIVPFALALSLEWWNRRRRRDALAV